MDGETLFLPASVWRDAAEHIAESLTKGMRVIASGLLKSRTYETKAGEKRTVVELEVEEIGLSMRFQNVAVSRTPGARQNNSRDGGDDTYRPSWSAAARGLSACGTRSGSSAERRGVLPP